MSAELLQLLSETALAAGAATAAVLALRLPVRRGFGARAAYALWWLVPAAILAVLLPAPRLDVVLPMVAPAAVASTAQPIAAVLTAPADRSIWLVLAWALGALALACTLALRQHRFRRRLGRLSRQPDGSWRADSSLAGPAVIGALRGRVVLPADFDERYTPLQRQLVLRHERVHIARFDLAANLLANALRCLHWFNPLLHYAIARFRFDQELAADALVLAQHPDARRDYADAMLSTQLLADPPPLGCHWQPAHPLKERIIMLKQPLPGFLRSAFGAVLAVALALCTGYAAWATQPARTESAGMRPGASELGLRTIVRFGQKPVLIHEAAVKGDDRFPLLRPEDGLGFGLDLAITSLTEQEIEVSANLQHAGSTYAQPRVRFRRGADASIAVSPSEGGLREDISIHFLYGTGSELLAKIPPELQGRPRNPDDASYARLSPLAYPAGALAAKAQGTVILRVLVDSDGVPAQVAVEKSSGNADLDASAQTKVRDWRFNPTRRDGRPVEAWVHVPVTFSIDGIPNSTVVPEGALDEIFVKAPQG